MQRGAPYLAMAVGALSRPSRKPEPLGIRSKDADVGS